MKKKCLFLTMILMAMVFIGMPKVEALTINTPEKFATYLNTTLDEDTITLTENAIIGSEDEVILYATIIIDLNGHTLTNNSTESIRIDSNAIIKNGTINGRVSYWETLTIENATITGLDGQAQSSTIIKGITTLNGTTNGNMTIENGATLIVNSNDFRFKYYNNGHLLTNNGTILIEDSNSVFTVDSGNSILNNGTIANYGTFTNDGTLASAGRILNNPYKLEKLAMTNGNIESDIYYSLGNETITLTINPKTGYMLKNGTLKVMNGQNEVPLTEVDDTIYTFTMPSADVTVFAEFKLIPTMYKITVNDENHFIVAPSSSIDIEEGNSSIITIIPDTGYRIKSAKIDGVPLELPLINNKITLTNVRQNHIIDVEVEKIVYEVLEGKDQTHTIGTDKNVVIKIDADKSLFSKLFINEVELGTDKYEVTEGSTIITLKKSYLDSLKKGTYNLKATFTDGGESTTSFTIANAIDNPKTGDNIINSLLLGSISLIGLLGASIYLKKKRFN